MNKIKKEHAKKAVEQNPEIQEQKTAVVEQEQPQVEQEKPKRVVHKKTEEEKAEIAATAKAKRDEEKRAHYLAELEAHWAEEREKIKQDREKAYRKFTCPELIRIFGGWFTLTYAFSVKKMQKVKGKSVEVKTDYYICSQDVNHLAVNERPALNKVILNEYGKDVYGFAIIAPATAFGEKLEE